MEMEMEMEMVPDKPGPDWNPKACGGLTVFGFWLHYRLSQHFIKTILLLHGESKVSGAISWVLPLLISKCVLDKLRANVDFIARDNVLEVVLGLI
jgi:hypothetical protein